MLRADDTAIQVAAANKWASLSREVRGAAAVAKTFSGRAGAARRALVNGAAGLARAPGGRPRVAFGLTITGEKIVAIESEENRPTRAWPRRGYRSRGAPLIWECVSY